jgi:hypothetical protein
MVQEVESLLCKCEALSSNFSSNNKNNKEKNPRNLLLSTLESGKYQIKVPAG